MAITQTAISKSGIGEINPASASGESYIIIGGIWVCIGQGAPVTGASGELKEAPKGSIYVATDLAKVYVKSSVADANTTWTDLTATS